MAHAAITAVMGTADDLLKAPDTADVKVPTPSCNAPSNPEALPAFLVNGASDNADELGNTKPWQHKKIKIKKMVLNNSRNPVIVPATSNNPVSDWHSNATRMISSLV